MGRLRPVLAVLRVADSRSFERGRVAGEPMPSLAPWQTAFLDVGQPIPLALAAVCPIAERGMDAAPRPTP